MNERDKDNQQNESEIVYDEEETSSFKMKGASSLKKKLEVCTRERQEYLDGWQRAKADLINARKEFNAERLKTTERAHADLIEDLLPVLDAFDMAISNKDAWEKADENWRKGVEYIHDSLTKTLRERGLSILVPKTGDPFDPAQHESVSSETTQQETLNGTVARVVQKGYALGDTVMRTPKVVIYELST